MACLTFSLLFGGGGVLRERRKREREKEKKLALLFPFFFPSSKKIPQLNSKTTTTQARLRALDAVAARARGLASLRQLRGSRRVGRCSLGRRRQCRFVKRGRRRAAALFVFFGGPHADARGLQPVRQGAADGRRVRGVGQVGDAVSGYSCVFIFGDPFF